MLSCARRTLSVRVQWRRSQGSSSKQSLRPGFANRMRVWDLARPGGKECADDGMRGCVSLAHDVEGMAGTTGLEPAASAVTGQRSNQLNYVPFFVHAIGAEPACWLLAAIVRPASTSAGVPKGNVQLGQHRSTQILTAGSCASEHLSMLLE